jgi:hypothetical protein
MVVSSGTGGRLPALSRALRLIVQRMTGRKALLMLLGELCRLASGIASDQKT